MNPSLCFNNHQHLANIVSSIYFLHFYFLPLFRLYLLEITFFYCPHQLLPFKCPNVSNFIKSFPDFSNERVPLFKLLLHLIFSYSTNHSQCVTGFYAFILSLLDCKFLEEKGHF